MTGISAAAVARSRTLGEARWSPGGARLAWLDSFSGRVDLVVSPADGAGPSVTVTAEVPVTGLGAYGGGGYCWVDDDTLVYAAADGRLLRVPASGGPLRVLARDGRAAAPAVSPDGTRVAFVLERDDSCDIALVDLRGEQWPRRLSHADYAWDPTWSADGRSVAWHEWDLPNMPWDGSRIVALTVDAPDESPRHIAGGDDVAVGQPCFAPVGDALAFVAETDGWMNVWLAPHAGDTGASPTCVLAEEREHAEPSWGPGQRSFVWSPDGIAIALNRNEDGFGRLVHVHLDGGEITEVSKGWHRGLDWGSAGIACIHSGGRTAPQLTVIDPVTGARHVRERGAPAELDAYDLPEPSPFTWRGADGEPVHGLLWLPPDAGRAAPPPLLVDVHGGPTDQSAVDWKVRIRWFTSRGWAVFTPNYRGSTGHGRAYRHALDHAWGDVDVTDTVAGIRALAGDERVDVSRAAVIGGSAGGFTALLVAACNPPVVRAAVSLFGVTDLFDLAATTHRFESHYLDRLVGTLPEHADRYTARAPVTRARDITVPVLVLQGADDKVVPPAQAQLFVDSMRASGGTVEHHVYEGEGHGFAQESSIDDSFARIETFLMRWVVQR